jgi:NAD(P)-dependent dehydrogenase (short-subunit alcohol dehydrogenase family)
MAQDLFRLDGKTVLVTGASSGLGRHFALLMAQAGASVALAARRIDVLEDLVQEINSASPKSSDAKAKAFQLDVSNAQQVSQCFDQLAAWHLPDVIINNAGVTITKPLLQQSESDWDQVIDTNLKGAWLVATEAARFV